MGDSKAFLTIHRQEAGYRPVHERITDYGEVEQTLNTHDRKLQASRCMDCGVPFCHWACPLGNKQPEWQDALYKGKWKEAYEILAATCDFPEFTGRICPALCEKSCVLKLSCDEPVTIRENEAAIVEAAFREGYITPVIPVRNGKRVAIIGAGPAGLVAANQLNRKGYTVTLFDKAEAPGGLLRFGIPNFKLNKNIIDRRMEILKAEGILFKMNTAIDTAHLPEGFDAYCICTGAETPRDLSIPGRELKGIHFALEMLSQQNRIIEGQTFAKDKMVNAKGKKVKNKWVTVKVKGKKQKYYFNKKGAALTGTAAVKNRLYGFDKKGRLNQKKSKKLAAYRQNSDFAGLKALIGEPKKAEYFDSCMGAGMDGILKYQGFIVYTYKENGKEIIQGFE